MSRSPRPPRSPLSRQGGSMLLEALIAILIFSMGVLAIVGMQAAAVKSSSDAKFRADASLLANELIGQMWVSDRTTAALQTKFNSPGGAAYADWLTNVQTRLPGVTASANTPTVTVAANGTVTIGLLWKLPSDPPEMAAHTYVAVAQIQ